MKYLRLVINSFFWGMVIALLAFQSQALEMMMNVGIIIPVVMIASLGIGILQRRAGKKSLLDFDAIFILKNAGVCIALAFLILGFRTAVERIMVVPAAMIRELLQISSVSFDTINIVIFLLVLIGIVISFYGEENPVKDLVIRNKWKVIGFLMLAVIYLFVPPVNSFINHGLEVLSKVDVQAVKEYILGFGVWAPVVSFMLMILQSVVAPLPAFIITFANAGLFGWIPGAILSWSSAMAGAVLCFYIAKFFGRNTVEKLTSKAALEGVDKFFGRYGKYAILIARLLPFISFDIVSYGAGLTSMSFWAFFVATGIGQLPATIVYSYIGGMLTGTAKTFVTGLLVLFSVSTLIMLLRKVWKDRKETVV
jgi:uncharacterized membrane protein YdjX (TVP38/TMEM64 family)